MIYCDLKKATFVVSEGVASNMLLFTDAIITDLITCFFFFCSETFHLNGSHIKSEPFKFYFFFPPLDSEHRSVSALSATRGRILSNLSCLMKNSASWLPISGVSGCCVRYRGGGAGERGGNCFGLQHCMISIITAMDLIRPHIL